MPRRITLRTALVFAMRDVLPQIFHHGAMRRDRTDGAALFAVGTFPGVVEEDEETVLRQLHGGGAGEDVADYFHYIFGGTVGCTVPHSVLGRRASLMEAGHCASTLSLCHCWSIEIAVVRYVMCDPNWILLNSTSPDNSLAIVLVSSYFLSACIGV
mmetsp:Transcript_9423/g.20389  ORF Transcript_9423/g.20389 Transcript_9423/m.20389 type:complete len:156 (-) Transcript_9423:225-692(-)